jgi:hypothetical protein
MTVGPGIKTGRKHVSKSEFQMRRLRQTRRVSQLSHLKTGFWNIKTMQKKLGPRWSSGARTGDRRGRDRLFCPAILRALDTLSHNPTTLRGGDTPA